MALQSPVQPTLIDLVGYVGNHGPIARELAARKLSVAPISFTSLYEVYDWGVIIWTSTPPRHRPTNNMDMWECRMIIYNQPVLDITPPTTPGPT